MLAGCSDIVRTEYKTLDDAKQTDAFSRGWLPPMLPDGTTNIVEINNVDLNAGNGSFRFPDDSIPMYLEHLGVQYGAAVTKREAAITITMTVATTSWKLELDIKEGKGTYSVNAE